MAGFLFALLCLLPELAMAASCSNFQASGRGNSASPEYTATLSNTRVSAIVNCTGDSLGTDYPTSYNDSVLSNTCNSTQCALFVPTDYAVQLHAKLNITLPSTADLQAMLTMIKNHLDLPTPQDYDFNETSTHFCGGSATCLNEGAAAWWNFAPIYHCVDGLVSGCQGDGAPAEGTPVQACGLRLLRDDHSLIDGAVNIVSTNMDPAPVPPNATAATNTATATATTTTTTPTQDSGAGLNGEPINSFFAFWGVLLAAVAFALQM